MAEVNTTNLEEVAPADRPVRPRWPTWKIVFAYAAMFAIAVGSIWVIDGHVLSATPPPTSAPTTPGR